MHSQANQSDGNQDSDESSNAIYQLRFYATAPYACSYLANQQARSQVATSTQLINEATYSELIRHGFRRSGLHVYRPHCDQCQACIPVRNCVNEFKPNRSQRRALVQHANLITTIYELHFNEEHFELYHRYQQQRHAHGGMDQDNREQYEQFLLQSNVNTRLIEFRDQDNILRMISIIDILEDGLSSVYTFFDANVVGASFGTFNVLWQIEKTKAMQLPYLYLGYWIADSRKMAYKVNFQPLQGLQHNQWQALQYTT